jgi:Transcriptional regulator PadR-like family
MDDLDITPKMAKVLKIFLEDPDQPRYGFEIMRLTGLASGSLYPMLARLEQAGWLTKGKETIDPHAEGRCCASLKMPMKAALAVPMWGCSKPRSRGGCGALVGVVPVAVGVVPVMCRCIR